MLADTHAGHQRKDLLYLSLQVTACMRWAVVKYNAGVYAALQRILL